MKRYYYLPVIVLMATFVTGTAGATPASAAAECQQVTRTVTLSPTDPTPYHLVGWLCADGQLANKTVQLLLSGLTYDHNYWNWTQQPQKYSYVRVAVDAGYATFNIDRLGVGLSDHPVDPDSLTTQSHAYVTHQLVQALRSGAIGANAFGTVVLTGHSFGSEVAMFEAATYADVDGVILTDLLHDLSPQTFTIVAPSMYPAFLDPKFSGSGLAPGYLTTMPGTRGTDFYNTTFADPDVIALDETLKQTATTGELATITDANPLTPQIHVPVLIGMGQMDILFCDTTLSCADSGTVLVREGSHYSAAACLEAVVLPNSGHDINLHPNSHTFFEQASNWADRRIGTNGVPPTQPCNP